MLHRRILLAAAAAVTAAVLAAPPSKAQDKSIVVASTTSTRDSGLFGYLLPKFTKKSGIEVKVVAQGTGKALDTGRRCDADVLFVHAKPAEEKFIKNGYGVKRFPVMYNDFVVIGPKRDPAGIKGMKSVTKAFTTLKNKKADFISRGDNSGTNKAEIRIWKAAGIDIKEAKGPWYKAIGQGMGATLNTAAASNAYTLTDRATWIHFKNKQNLVIEVQGDPRLFNQYGVFLVNPKRCPHVKAKLGREFIHYLISPEGQKVIAGYRVQGKQLFHPDANKPGA
ncbi:MAG: substrate-binding domain-containing protein [Pseudolabrys sp.]